MGQKNFDTSDIYIFLNIIFFTKNKQIRLFYFAYICIFNLKILKKSKYEFHDL